MRRREFSELAEVLDEAVKEFGCLKDVRWLALRMRAGTALRFNYKVLVKDLESKSYECNEDGNKAAGYLVQLKYPRF